MAIVTEEKRQLRKLLFTILFFSFSASELNIRGQEKTENHYPIQSTQIQHIYSIHSQFIFYIFWSY